MIAQEVRPLVVGGEDNGVTIRQFIEIDRELLAAPAGLAAEPEATIAAACCWVTAGEPGKIIGSFSGRLSRGS